MALLLMLLMDIDNLLHLLLASQENSAPVVDVFGHDFEHPAHVTVDGKAAGCL